MTASEGSSRGFPDCASRGTLVGVVESESTTVVAGRGSEVGVAGRGSEVGVAGRGSEVGVADGRSSEGPEWRAALKAGKSHR